MERTQYTKIQAIAKQTIAYIKSRLKPGMSLTQVRSLCEQKLLELGADSFWYWNVGAFVFAGDETALSVSGKSYITSDRRIGEKEILTIDLSPQWQNFWGDYARTIVMEDGIVVENILDIKDKEWRNGLLMEELLHEELLSFAKPETTFEELYFHMNAFLREHGYINLDFMGNLGHSIVKEKSERIYIERGNYQRLNDVELFTFEPHISVENSKFGYKKENIYYFENDKLLEL